MSDWTVFAAWCVAVAMFVAVVWATTPDPRPKPSDHRKWWRRPPS